MGTCFSKKSVCANASSAVTLPEKKCTDEQPPPVVKKEIFIIKHRASHEIERHKSEDESEKKHEEELAGNGDAPNCAVAPVRTSSCTKEEVDAILIQCGRLSRSSSSTGKAAAGGSSENARRQYSGSKRSYDFDNETGRSDGGNNGDDERENRRRERHRQSPGRRRTPSRERERDQLRSGSRERGSGGGRRISRSPGRRSESPITTTANSDQNSNPNTKPGKMVSVPATVSIDKPSDASNAIKRIQVKRNARSPRARSPARRDNVSLSRSNSRKADNSPYRRNPLAEIDTNVIVPPKANADTRPLCKEEAKPSPFAIAENIAMNVIQENPKPQTITRSRSSRLSRDLNAINPDSLLNSNANGSSASSSSYTALLLEDIQNFHQKKSSPPGAFTLPPCVTKAQSILDAVADLNAGHVPVLESEVVGNGDDLMEPSFHKYVTVRRGGGTDDFEEQQESSGSNSITGSQQQHWVPSSSWEPNSAESTDRCAVSSSSRAVSKQSSMLSESGGGVKRVATAKRRDCDGIGRGRIGTRGTHTIAAAAST